MGSRRDGGRMSSGCGALAGMMGLVVLLAAPGAAARELPDAGLPNSHEAFLGQLSSAENDAFEALLGRYDEYLAIHPGDATAATERCRFLAEASCDDDECPHWEEAEQCREALARRFPGLAPVELYRLERTWGNQGIALGERLLDEVAGAWTAADRAALHRRLANLYDQAHRKDLAIQHAQRAMELDPSIDLTLLAAPLLRERGQRDLALDMLRSRAGADAPYWQRVQKVELFAQLGAFEDAAVLLDASEPPPDVEPDPLLRADVWIGLGEPDRARESLDAAARSSRWQWRSSEILAKRFDLELAHGDEESAVAAYEHLRDQGFWADPFLKSRLALALRHPSAPWRVRDLQGLAAAVALVVFILGLPGLLLVPVHYVGLVRSRSRPDEVPAPSRWGLRHAWYALGLVLVADVPLLYTKGNGDLEDIANAFRTTKAAARAVVEVPDRSLALAALVGIAIVAVGLLPLLRHGRLPIGWGSWSRRHTLTVAFGALVLLRLGLGIWVVATSGLDPHEAGGVGLLAVSLTERTCLAIGRIYGLLLLFGFVVVAVPCCEEVIFRGVLLQGLMRYLRGGWANLLQATAFALLHEEWRLFPFYVALGLVAGAMARRSRSLVGPVLLHAGNNAIAFAAFAAAH